MEKIAHYCYGDHIDTDRIIPGKYTKTLDLSQLASHVLEDLDPTFSTSVKKGDILVAGENFGCGSSREQAPLALKHAGVYLIIAKSFARIFYRNAINIGLPIFEIPSHQIQKGDELQIDLDKGFVQNRTQNVIYNLLPMPAVMMNIVKAGGLTSYIRRYGDYQGN